MKLIQVKSPFQFRVKEVEIPHPNDTQVLIQVKACGVCGTDMHIAKSQAEDWESFGHEISGVVVEVGKHVTTCKKGDKVVVESGSFCHTCDICRNGRVDLCTEGFHTPELEIQGYAEYMVLPQQCVVPFDGIDFAQATIVEPLGVALDLFYTTDVQLNDDVAVIGLGPIGLMALRLAKLAGARNIYAIQRSRRSQARIELAKEFGATEVIFTDETPLSEYPFPRGGVEKVMVTASPSTLSDAFHIATVGGIIGYIGIDYGPGGMVTFDGNEFHFKKLQLRSSYAAPALWFPRCLELMKSKAVDPYKMVTHTFHMDEFETYMDKMRNNSADVIKMVMVND